ARGGAARSIAAKTGTFAGHGVTGHESGGHSRAPIINPLARYQIRRSWLCAERDYCAANLSFLARRLTEVALSAFSFSRAIAVGAASRDQHHIALANSRNR